MSRVSLSRDRWTVSRGSLSVLGSENSHSLSCRLHTEDLRSSVSTHWNLSTESERPGDDSLSRPVLCESPGEPNPFDVTEVLRSAPFYVG